MIHKLNPFDFINDIYGKNNDLDLAHLEFDPELDQDIKEKIDADEEKSHCHVRMIRSCKCDGTFYFLHELMTDCINTLITKSLIYKGYDLMPSSYKIGSIHYDIEDVENTEPSWIHTRFVVAIPVKFIYA